MTDPMNELLRAQQDAAAQFTESWRTLLRPGAGRTARSSAPPDADDPEQHLLDTDPADDADEPERQLVDAEPASDEAEPEPEPQPSVANAFQAIRALRDGQHDLAQHLTRWADMQRDLAEATSVWARRQRDQTDALDRLLASFPPAPAERPVEP